MGELFALVLLAFDENHPVAAVVAQDRLHSVRTVGGRLRELDTAFGEFAKRIATSVASTKPSWSM